MRKIRRKKNNTLVLLVALLAFMTIGYSILSTNLNITGASTINNPTWDIHWNNVQVNSNSNATVTSGATINSGKTEVAFNITLNKPGDLYEFTVDAVNAGSIDGMIDVITKKVYQSNGTTETTLPDYLEYQVTYSDDLGIYQKHSLNSGQTETYKVRVYFKRDIEANQLPQTATTLVFKFGVTYVQKDNTALVSRLKYGIPSITDNIITYTTNFSQVNQNGLYLTVSLSANGNEYSKINYYSSDTHRYYSIIGGDGGIYYQRNYDTIRPTCTERNTQEYDTYFYCDTTRGYIIIYKSGAIRFYNSSVECRINADKSIECYGLEDSF